MEDRKYTWLPAMQLQYVLQLFGCNSKGITDIAHDLFWAALTVNAWKLAFKHQNPNQLM